jgi:hypothetical protein
MSRGTAGTTGLSQLDTFALGGATFGPLPAAVQDIGALPNKLDGIIGLSFLSQFTQVEMDFIHGKVTFCKSAPPKVASETVLAQADMNLVKSLGIYTVDVLLGGRGPVKMLVDTGAASSFMNWKGIEDLHIARDSKAISPIPGSMGAMGSDNMAIQLTHRLHVSSNLNLGRSSDTPGLSLDKARLPLDIGQIPILDSLASDGVLIADRLVQARYVRTCVCTLSRLLMYITAGWLVGFVQAKPTDFGRVCCSQHGSVPSRRQVLEPNS